MKWHEATSSAPEKDLPFELQEAVTRILSKAWEGDQSDLDFAINLCDANSTENGSRLRILYEEFQEELEAAERWSSLLTSAKEVRSLLCLIPRYSHVLLCAHRCWRHTRQPLSTGSRLTSRKMVYSGWSLGTEGADYRSRRYLIIFPVNADKRTIGLTRSLQNNQTRDPKKK